MKWNEIETKNKDKGKFSSVGKPEMKYQKQ